MQNGPATPVDGARVLAVEGDYVVTSALRIGGVEMRERIPAAAEAHDLDIVLAASIGNGLDHRVEAGNVAATRQYTDVFLRHDRLSTAVRESVRWPRLAAPHTHQPLRLVPQTGSTGCQFLPSR